MTNIKLLNFTELSYELTLMVLSWRNHEKVRKCMLNQDEISLNNHLAFIEYLKTTKEKLYFLVQQNDNFIGVIDFYNFKDSSCEFGLYANPEMKLAGIGKILTESSIKYAFDVLKLSSLKLEVFSDNAKALGLYRSFNFKEYAQKKIDEKTLISMELNNKEKTNEDS